MITANKFLYVLFTFAINCCAAILSTTTVIAAIEQLVLVCYRHCQQPSFLGKEATSLRHKQADVASVLFHHKHCATNSLKSGDDGWPHCLRCSEERLREMISPHPHVSLLWYCCFYFVRLHETKWECSPSVAGKTDKTQDRDKMLERTSRQVMALKRKKRIELGVRWKQYTAAVRMSAWMLSIGACDAVKDDERSTRAVKVAMRYNKLWDEI